MISRLIVCVRSNSIWYIWVYFVKFNTFSFIVYFISISYLPNSSIWFSEVLEVYCT